MELVFAFAAGLLTLLNPCVLPVLPIAATSALDTGRAGPVALAAGMSLSFTVLGVLISAFGPAIGISPELIARAFAVLMVVFGLMLLSPILNTRFAMATAGVSNIATRQLGQHNGGSLGAQFFGGMLLGAVWVPCIGPTLGGAIALASQGAELGRAAAIMLAYSVGVGVLIVAIACAAKSVGSWAFGFSRFVKPITGSIFILIGLGTLLGAVDIAAGHLLDLMPIWLQDLSVAI